VYCGAVLFLGSESSKYDNAFKNSEWETETAAEFYKKVKDFPIIGGADTKLTIQDLMNWTPKHVISKVVLEEKVFQPWYSGRTVLLGDC